MKIAIPTKDFRTVCGHAGQARRWLLYTLPAPVGLTQTLPAAEEIELPKEMAIHHFNDQGPHPLDGVDLILSFSAGDGFFRRMEQRGTRVLLTGEPDPVIAIRNFLAGDAQPKPPFDITAKFCKIHDLFSRHRKPA
ncbi:MULTISPECIES: NifB/NifX family molybdenum-iron cluster-binding protein [Uliginosibacterium]|uniref:Dinitrogenase iron-molybdenum cofactor biosynthesis domain-containing protein n=1 Tax=Uliginosibacterium aquaticum TaxID=2731212 RepID=A0ABX2IGZ8_9RHOO|nr:MULTISPECIES: hypothetical protein [Uliginosibacterium]MDO6386742.1 hypothetical protein [Uliginosibacterium sp. 31-12]NSL55787.1 hypothetical protein [Uliginosibacterium aquaticum]PLK50564.1 hypothetical protein C0V76_01715 [Uliginosibacterium sp. TH139]